jgi:hypothetical protein
MKPGFVSAPVERPGQSLVWKSGVKRQKSAPQARNANACWLLAIRVATIPAARLGDKQGSGRSAEQV